MVRLNLVVVLIVVGMGAVASAAPAPARAARQVTLILPPVSDGEGIDLAVVMQTRAAALLVRTGGYQDVHLKQILRVAEREGMSPAMLATAKGADLLSRRLGATHAVFGTLVRHGAGWTLTATLTPDAHQKALHVELPAEPTRAVEAGALALASLVAGTKIVAGPPPTTSDAAMTAYARCYAIVLQQPLVVDQPMILDDAQLKDAVTSCRAAVSADPKFSDAAAALGLVLALSGDDDAAVHTLAGVQEGDGYLPLYWLGRYWLVTRYQSADAGGTALRKAIELHPYFLLAYGYLAEHENVLHHDEAALAAWRAYQTQLPRGAFVRDRASHSLARLGRNDEAIAEARAALADAPDDNEAKLELADRQLDAGHSAEGIAILEPMVAAGARAEVVLRLGYAYAGQGNVVEAEKLLRRAQDEAQRPDEWRTRARARLDLGVLLVKGGRVEEGQQLLVSSKHSGLANYIAAQKNVELKQMVADAEVAQRDKKVADYSIKIPRETSPFDLDAAGEIAPAFGHHPEPKMFEVLKF